MSAINSASSQDYKMPDAIKNLNQDVNPHRTKMQSMKVDEANGPLSKKEQLMADRDAYLQLLLTQLKNQNPQEPTDTNQMTQQIISISQAEQTIQLNENIEKMLKLEMDNHRMNSLNLIGKEIAYDESTQLLSSGKKNEYQFALPKNAERVDARILDDQGKVVRFVALDESFKRAGTHNFQWDGRDDNGDLLQDGKYKMFVDAYDKRNVPIEVSSSTKSLVIGVVEEGGVIKLMLDSGKTINEDRVTSYYQNSKEPEKTII